MKKRNFSYSLIYIEVLFVFLALMIIGNILPRERAYYHVGIAVYNMEDPYMQEYMDQLQDELDNYNDSDKKVLYEILDAKGDLNRQEKKLQYMISQNFDVLLLNLVEPASAASVLNEASDLEIPVILFNRETENQNMTISDTIWYVGTDAKVAGALQGDMLVKLWQEKKDVMDHNQNGKLDYVLIEGEETHFDAIRRTNGFLERASTIELNQLTSISASWKRTIAYESFSKLNEGLISNIEAVICHNDDMALGIYDYYKANNLEIPVIIGINNNPELYEKIKAKEIYGTVDNDTKTQVIHICELIDSILQGKTKEFKKIWYGKPYAITRD